MRFPLVKASGIFSSMHVNLKKFDLTISRGCCEGCTVGTRKMYGFYKKEYLINAIYIKKVIIKALMLKLEKK